MVPLPGLLPCPPPCQKRHRGGDPGACGMDNHGRHGFTRAALNKRACVPPGPGWRPVSGNVNSVVCHRSGEPQFCTHLLEAVIIFVPYRSCLAIVHQDHENLLQSGAQSRRARCTEPRRPAGRGPCLRPRGLQLNAPRTEVSNGGPTLDFRTHCELASAPWGGALGRVKPRRSRISFGSRNVVSCSLRS